MSSEQPNITSLPQAPPTFDTVIEGFIRDGVVSIETALPYATNQNKLLLKIADLDGAPPPT